MSKNRRSLRFIAITVAIISMVSLGIAANWSSVNPLDFLRSDAAAPMEETDSTASATLLAVGSCDTGQNIDVEATGGTAQTGYATLTAAIAAINGGTHQGVINIEVCANTSEAAAIVLNSSGAGSASYTSINIHPLIDNATISGPTVTGRGLIELNGADNVTIDGDNPNSAGTNRNLTLTNTAATATTFTSVVRIALATSIVTTADNNTIKNLVINGSATGRNGSGFTSTTGAEANTYGVIASSGASTVAATTAPSAVSSLTATIASPATGANLTITNNTITTAARGIWHGVVSIDRSQCPQ